MRVVERSTDARAGPDEYIANNTACVAYLDAEGIWERQRHLDVLLSAKAPTMAGQSAGEHARESRR